MSLYLTKNLLLRRTSSYYRSSSSTATANSTRTTRSYYDDDEEELILKKEIDRANRRFADKIRIVRSTKMGMGWTVYAATDFTKGQVVFTSLALERTTKPHSHTVQTGYNSHAVMDVPGRLLNHACSEEANLGVQLPLRRTAVYKFVATQDIYENDELLYDYETTEYEITRPFECYCGSVHCRNTAVRGFRYNKDIILEEHKLEFIAPYLLKDPPEEEEEKDDK